MTFTGERYLPAVGGSIELEHIHRYLFAVEYVKDKVVLDIACGEGYGSNILGRVATKVYGVDIDKSVIEHASKNYLAGNLEFKAGDCKNIPLDDQSVDVIISFETIEHHDHHEEMLSEFRRVMKNGGILIISSPDKLEYSDLTGYVNPYHVKELYRGEFETLLGNHFRNFEVLGQRVVYASVLHGGSNSQTLSTIKVSDEGDVSYTTGITKAIYLVAIASDDDIPNILPSIYEKPVYESELVQDLLAESSEQQATIREYEAKMEGHEAKIKEHEVEIGDLRNQLLQNQLLLESVSHERDEIVNSKIWRWTTLLRKF
jgi:SAM-dependent methyltransferase